MENLGRGVVASRTASNTAYISWRLLGHEAADTGFNLYRSRNGATPVKLNATPLTLTTDYRDTSAGFPQSVSYHVRTVVGGVEGAPSASFTLPGDAPTQQFIPIPMDKPPGGVTPSGEAYDYLINDISVGDLNGNGEYEFIVKWDPSNAKDNAQSGYTGNVFLDAYTLAGTRLWRIDLGRNIRAGAHYTQFIVYDLDGDGIAEISCKTAPGTIDGVGNPVLLAGHNVNADYRNSSGYILAGPEYLTVFNGGTGAAMATVRYNVPRHPTTENPSGSQLNAVWGDSYGNRVDRFLAGVAYLDGQRPSLIMSRGYYTRTAIAAWDWRNGQLTLRWLFDTYGNSALNGYRGQGNHQLAIADVDGDGRDEIIFGSMTVDDNGTGLYTTGLGHGDALHVSDFDPDRPGLEVFMPHESPGSNGGIGASFRDAATGQVIWSTPATGDVGRGVIMDLDPRFPGAEAWATNSGDIYAADGSVVGPRGNAFTNFAVWWEGGPIRQLMDNTTISRWNYAAGGGRQNILTAWQQGAAQSNGTKSTPALSGDILGDWREEVIWKNTDSTALLLFTTTVSASGRLHTLLHDPTYRMAIAWQNVSYNQPPHPGFFLGHDMPTPPRSPIWNGDLVWKGGSSPQTWGAGSSTFKSAPTATDTAAYSNGKSVLFDLSGNTSSAIQIQGELTPSDVVVHNPVGKNYTFTGPGGISGTTSFTKSGPGLLTLGGTHSYTGKTTVNQGELRLAGSLSSSAVSVQGLGRLSGSGLIGGGLATSKRASISPGTGPGNVGNIAVTGATALVDTTLEFDLPTSGTLHDALAVTGNLALSGVNPLVFRVASGGPAPGTYPLITYTGSLTGGLANLQYDPSFTTLQTQLVVGSGAINLIVLPPPLDATLVWRGTGSVWDQVSQNWLLDGQPSLFSKTASVVFGPHGAAAPVISIEGTVEPKTVTVDSSTAYTINGPGVIGGDAILQKSNSGSLTISNGNTFTGGTVISGGTLTIGSAAALGTGPVTLAGGTWGTGVLTPNNPILVAADSTITGGSSGGAHGIKAVSGSRNLTLTATNVFDLEGDLSGFSGTFFLNGSGSFRLFGSSNGGSTTFDLGTRWLSSRSGTAHALGALAGAPGSALNGASGYTSAVTYTLGAKGVNSTFAGAIINGTGLTHIIKTGTGVLTLSGNSTHTGNTTIQSGTIELTGSLAATPTTIQAEGQLSGNGSIAGSVTNHGTLSPEGTLTFGNGLTSSQESVLEFHLGASSDRIAVSGNLTLAGRIEVSASPGIATGIYPLITYTGSPNFGNIELVSLPGDFTCQLDLSTPGQVNALITSTLSAYEQWQILHFGSTDNPLAQANEDPDGDGQSNDVEFLAGTDPQNGASLFAATLVPGVNGELTLTWPSVSGKSYQILKNTELSGPWETLQLMVAGPGATSSVTLSPGDHGPAAFFKVAIVE
jgi:autotransporter-associated beta strand protein